MTIRLTCDINDTKALLAEILRETNQGERVMFLAAPGKGWHTLQRCKVMLSRIRVKMQNKGRKRRHFQLNSTIHPHTENGKRHDAVIVWQTQSLANQMVETLEDLIGTGDML